MYLRSWFLQSVFFFICRKTQISPIEGIHQFVIHTTFQITFSQQPTIWGVFVVHQFQTLHIFGHLLLTISEMIQGKRSSVWWRGSQCFDGITWVGRHGVCVYLFSCVYFLLTKFAKNQLQSTYTLMTLMALPKLNQRQTVCLLLRKMETNIFLSISRFIQIP